MTNNIDVDTALANVLMQSQTGATSAPSVQQTGDGTFVLPPVQQVSPLEQLKQRIGILKDIASLNSATAKAEEQTSENKTSKVTPTNSGALTEALQAQEQAVEPSKPFNPFAPNLGSFNGITAEGAKTDPFGRAGFASNGKPLPQGATPPQPQPQQTEFQKAGNTGSNLPVQKEKKGNTALKDAGSQNPQQEAPALPQEFDGFANMYKGVSTRKSGATLDELENFKSSVQSIQNNAIEKLNQVGQQLGTLDDIDYAVNHPNASADTVAKYIAEAKGLDNKQAFGLSQAIDKLQASHSTLSPAVIGMALKQHLVSDENTEYWRKEYKIADDLHFVQSDLDDALNALKGDGANSYKNIKETHGRVKNMFNEIKGLDRSYQTALAAVNQQISDQTNYEGRAASKYVQKYIDNNNRKSYEASQALLQNAIPVFEKLSEFSKGNQ